MQRMLASLLLMLTSFGAALPFVQEQQTSIPACCRRDGSHHCTAMSTTADGFKAAGAKCPYQHLSIVAPAATAIPHSRQPLRLSLSPDPAWSGETMLVAIRDGGNVSKRGPPTV